LFDIILWKNGVMLACGAKNPLLKLNQYIGSLLNQYVGPLLNQITFIGLPEYENGKIALYIDEISYSPKIEDHPPTRTPVLHHPVGLDIPNKLCDNHPPHVVQDIPNKLSDICQLVFSAIPQNDEISFTKLYQL
jgi:hypothetical protein